MHEMQDRYRHDPCAKDLRARKKATTRRAIEQAAVEIAYEQGYEAATVEAIAARADISLRTFFNYFPSKDIAIVGRGPSVVDEQRARRLLEDSGTDLLKGIVRVVEECEAKTRPDSDLMRRRRRILRTTPHLLHPLMTEFDRFESELVGVVVGHLEAFPVRRRLSGRLTVDEEARLAVAVVASAVRYRAQELIRRDINVELSFKDIEEIMDMMAKMRGVDS